SLLVWAVVAQSPSSPQSSASNPQIESVHQQRVQMRAARHQSEILQMDSIVLSRYYKFTPSSFQQEPAGNMHNIYSITYSLSIYDNYMDVDLPYLVGSIPPYQLTIMNYITFDVRKYTAIQNENGWTITFLSDLYSANTYTFTLTLYSITREAVLNIASELYPTVTYYGSIDRIY
ncbi:MAG: DUF4251 domain-containing protein, partial [Alistipes sp.]|nr:DUF4251 domain-containing protein [Alistipes sp.]